MKSGENKKQVDLNLKQKIALEYKKTKTPIKKLQISIMSVLVQFARQSKCQII